MIEILKDNPWLIVVLGGLMIPVLGILMGAWSAWLWARDRRAALHAIETFAAQGREPPPELLRAVGGGGRWARHHGGRSSGGGDESGGPAMGMSAEDREAIRSEWRQGWRDYRRGEPLRTWRRAIVFCALAAGFYAGALYADPGAQGGLMITAIIMGALGAATLLSAILTTIFREK